MRIFALLILTLATNVLAQSAAPSPMTTTSTAPAVIWPAPEGWRTETIPFPLDFAPALPYTGYEELRFSPDFGKSDRQLYFTYGFLWVIPESVELKRETLEHDMKVYFDGLMKEVGKSKKNDLSTLDTKVAVVDAPPGPDGFKWTATIETVDAFFTHAPLKLEMHVIPNVRMLPGWRAHYFEATVLPVNPAASQALTLLRAALSVPPVAPAPIERK
jgi:hypothetical protein